MARIALLAALFAVALAGRAQAYVYWTDVGAGTGSNGTTVTRANNDGGGRIPAFVDGAAGPAGIAVDGAHVYWANTQTNSIGRANLDGGAADPSFIPNATSGGMSATPSDVALDGKYVYWSDGTRYIGRATLRGQGAAPHFVDNGLNTSPTGLAVDAATIYFVAGNLIRKVPAGGGTPATVATIPGDPVPLDLDTADGYLYWAQLDIGQVAPAGSIGRALLNGTNLDTKYIAGLTYPTGVATDGKRIYWVDHVAGRIGRAKLAGNGVTDLEPTFAADNSAHAVAINSLIDATQTSVSCTPQAIAAGSPTSCTATVIDQASPAPPKGSVAFSGDGSTFFSGASSSCTLVKQATGASSCVVAAVPLLAGTIPISANYAGDAVHAPSAGATTVCSGCGGGGAATPPSGEAPAPGPVPVNAPSTGGGASSGPSDVPATAKPVVVVANAVRCVVPRLKGKTLGQAQSLLKRAHCKLGSVKRPRHKRRRLRVGSQRPAAGKLLPANAKVALTLARRR